MAVGQLAVRQRAVCALILNALVWGVSWWPLRALGRAGLDSLWATSLVYCGCLAALGALALGTARTAPGAAPPVAARGLARARAGSEGSVQAARRVGGRHRWHEASPLIAVALAAGTTNACFNWGVASGDVVRVVLLFYLMPLWSMLLARIWLAEPLRWSAAGRAALALAGAALVLAPEAAGLPAPRDLPEWLGLAGGAAFAATNVLLRRAAGRPATQLAAAMFAGGALVPGLLAVTLAAAGALAWPPAPAAGWLVGLLGLSAAFLVGNLALQYGAARLSAATTSVVMLTEVVFAAGSAVLLGAAGWSAATLAGGALILASAAWAARPEPPVRPA